MTLETFIDNNRREIDAHIKTACPNCYDIDDDERETWIMNDESLYLWAKEEEVEDIY